MDNRKISVVIPFYNSEETLNLCLTSICNQSVKPNEIILVDNDSSDGSEKIVRSFINDFPELGIINITCKKKGPSAARNKGAALATGEWLIFTDSDCVPYSRWISDYIEHFGSDDIGGVAGCIKPYLSRNLIQKSLSLFTLPENAMEMVHAKFKLNEGLYPTANLAVRKDVFEFVGGFNEELKYGEDRELCYKIYKHGYKIKAIKDAAVDHIHRESFSGFMRQSFGFGSAHPFELRHFSEGAIIITAPCLKFLREVKGIRLWLDLNQADKKFVFTLIIGVLWWPLYFLTPIYFLYLCLFVKKIALFKNIKLSLYELPILAFILLLKSFFLTCGRISYSVKHRVICI